MARLASRLALGVALLSLAASSTDVSTADAPGPTDWPSTNYAQSANRYSPLTQITTKNVSTLQQVWSIHLKPADFTGRMREDEAIPIVIGNTMYLASPYGAVIALGRHDRRAEMEISTSQQRAAVEARRCVLAGWQWRWRWSPLSRRRSSSGPPRASCTPSGPRTARATTGLREWGRQPQDAGGDADRHGCGVLAAVFSNHLQGFHHHRRRHRRRAGRLEWRSRTRGRYARLGRQDRQAALDVSHDTAAGRARL